MSGRGSLDEDLGFEADAEDYALARRLLQPLGDRPGPAHRRTQPTSQATAKAAVEAALAIQERLAQEEQTVPFDFPPMPTFGAREQPRRWRRGPTLLAACLGLLSLGALGAVVVERAVRIDPPQPAPSARPAALVAPPPAPAPAPVVNVEPEVEVEVAGPSIEEPVDLRPPAPSPVKSVGKAKATRHRRIRVPRGQPALPSAASEVDLSSAPLEDLFALGNRLRRAREWQSADEVYGAVVERFPGTDAAVVAQIASATLHLEPLRDAPGALVGYRTALAAGPTGALAEEARWGIAEAFRVMGNRSAELAALKEFVRRHPAAGLAPTARKRIAELHR